MGQKQILKNTKDLRAMAEEIERLGPSAPKELVELYDDLRLQNMDATRVYGSSRQNRYLPDSKRLMGGEVFPAEDVFEMWSGRPTKKGKKGGLIKLRDDR
jgi:hypothetical protein